MSYLNIPRLHFAGRFQADPSTVNNNDANWDPNTKLSNDRNAPGWVYWNPTGTHNWQLVDCTVRGAANDQGQFTAPSADPIIGAKVLSSGEYSAKLVDLDPDNQGVSQIWGLQVQISIPDPNDAAKVLASVTGMMPPTAFGDLWNRATNAPGPGMPTMSAAFQAVLQDVTWVNAAASPLLAALQNISPTALSIRFNVDSYQPDSNQSNFTYGRVVGTIGPDLPTEAPRSTPRRLAPVQFWDHPPLVPQNLGTTPTIFSTYGAAGAVWDKQRSVLIIDLGNCLPTNGTPPTSGPSVPDDGWPIAPSTLQVTIPGSSVSPTPSHIGLKSGREVGVGCGAPAVVGSIEFTLATYKTYAGIVEIPVAASLVDLLGKQPMTLTDVTTTNPTIAVQEDAEGRYVDVDVPFLRLNPGDSAQVTLWATKFGQPWPGATLPVALQPSSGPPADNGGPWKNNDPQSALKLSTSTVTTGSNGTGTLRLTASDPGTPRTYPDGNPGPDGQVYQITDPTTANPPGDWPSLGQIFLFPGAPINVLVFSSYPMTAQPNWDEHVEPIFSLYARLAPYMKGIIDLSDYDTVKENASDIEYVLNLPPTDPHFMPVVRDLSADKLAMINQWFKNGMLKSAT